MTESSHTIQVLAPSDGQNTSGLLLNNPEGNKSPNASPTTLEDAHQNLGARIRAARELQGVTAEQLGHDFGMSASEILQIEAGEIDATLCTLLRLAERLSITIEDLFEGI